MHEKHNKIGRLLLCVSIVMLDIQGISAHQFIVSTESKSLCILIIIIIIIIITEFI